MTKLAFATLAAASVCCVTPAVWAVGLANPSFELANPANPAQPADWSTNFWGDFVASFTWAADGHSGRSGRVDVSAGITGDAKWISAPIAIEAGTEPYVVGDWYRSSAPGKIIALFNDGGAQNIYVDVTKTAESADWAQATGKAQPPAWAKTMQLMHTISASGFLQVDDYTAQRPEPVAPPKAGKFKATVSITFDDGWLSAYNLLIPKLDKLGIKATHFMITGYLDKPGYQSDYMTTKQLQKLIDNGHEICSHTVLHITMTDLTSDEVASTMDDSKAALQKLGVQSDGFAPPYGMYTDAIRDRAKQTYPYFRNIKPLVNFVPYPIHDLNCLSVLNITTLKEVGDLLAQAESQEGGWLILLFHRASYDAPYDVFVTPQQFQNIIQLLQDHNADIRPMGEVLGLWKSVVVPPPPPVTGGKSLPAPDAVDFFQAAPPTGADSTTSGCSAKATAGAPSVWPLLLLLPLWLRRRSVRY